MENFLAGAYNRLRPERRFAMTRTMATTMRMWTRPPMEVLVTMPRSQRTNKIIAIVYNTILFIRGEQETELADPAPLVRF